MSLSQLRSRTLSVVLTIFAIVMGNEPVLFAGTAGSPNHSHAASAAHSARRPVCISARQGGALYQALLEEDSDDVLLEIQSVDADALARSASREVRRRPASPPPIDRVIVYQRLTI
jgi:hypothetical protein